MISFRAGETAGKGTYWNMRTGERVDINTEGRLPGERNEMYLRIPVAAILLAGPVIGFLFVIFVPFIGIAMAVKLGVDRVAGRVLEPALSASTFGWRPRESYLSGKKIEGKNREEVEKTEQD